MRFKVAIEHAKTRKEIMENFHDILPILRGRSRDEAALEPLNPSSQGTGPGYQQPPPSFKTALKSKTQALSQVTPA